MGNGLLVKGLRVLSLGELFQETVTDLRMSYLIHSLVVKEVRYSIQTTCS